MALEYIVPRVAVDESDVGPRPTQAVSLATIGLVGTFSKGPLNTPVTVGSFDQLVNLFGGYKAGLTGYPAALMAMCQGAQDFKVVRVAGSTVKAASLLLKSATNADSVKVEAKTPGTWGNDIKVAVTAGTAAGTWRLVVVYGRASETIDNLTLDNLAGISSNYVTASKVGGATAIPAALASTNLAGGDDGAATTDSDYVGTVAADGSRSGLKVLDTVRVGLVICAGQSGAAVQNALIAHCMAATLDNGYRIAVLNTASGLSADAAAATTASLDSMRAVLAYPWLEPSDLAGTYFAPDGAYAGRLSVLAAHQSPTNKLIDGIISAERLFTPAEVKTLTLSRISPVTLVPGRGHRVRNGLTLSSDQAWAQISIRRAFDQLEMELYDGLQWCVGEPNTPTMRLNVAAQCDALLFIKKMKGEIYDYMPTVCDDTNNTPETIAARMLNIKVRVRPVYPADYVDVSIQRLLSAA